MPKSRTTAAKRLTKKLDTFTPAKGKVAKSKAAKAKSAKIKSARVVFSFSRKGGVVTVPVAVRLGGRKTFKKSIETELALAEAVEEGLPLSVLEHAIEFLTPSEIGGLIIPPRTRSHREAKKEPLTSQEGDRLVRLARIFDHASRGFGSQGRGAEWLRTPHSQLDGRTPIEVCETEAGARLVERLIAAIEWGAVA